MNSDLFDKDINFICNRVIAKEVVIDRKIEVIGDNLKFIGDIIVKSDVTFVNIKFINMRIYIENSASVSFESCSFINREDSSIVMMLDSNSQLSIIECSFENRNTAIVCNNNYIRQVINNKFLFCRVAIDINDFDYLVESEENLLLSYKDSVFVKVRQSKHKLSTAIKICKLLSNKNRDTVIECCSEDKQIIRTRRYYISTREELTIALKEVENGSTIILSSNTYHGDLFIDKSIEIVGQENVKFIPSIKYKNIAAFIISADFVQIKNINIEGNKELQFRDGIKFSNIGGEGCAFEKISIKDVRRRGISIWGKRTNNTVIRDSNVYNIKNSGIFVWGNVKIVSTRFYNCYIAITMLFNNRLNLEMCFFKTINKLLIIDDERRGNIVLGENYFKGIREFVENNY